MKRIRDAAKFEDILREVDSPSNKSKSCIKFKYTWLPSVDSVILNAQNTVNRLHQIRNDVLSGIDKLNCRTGVWMMPNADTSHAILALIYSIMAQTNGEDVDKIIKFLDTFPFIHLESKHVNDEVLCDINTINGYLDKLEIALKETPTIIDDCFELAKNAKSLKQNVKEEYEKQDQAMSQKTKQALKHNVEMLKKIKYLAKNTMKLLARTSEELSMAVHTIKDEYDNFSKIGKMLNEEEIFAPRECLVRLGKEIATPTTPLSSINNIQYMGNEEDSSELIVSNTSSSEEY